MFFLIPPVFGGVLEGFSFFSKEKNPKTQRNPSGPRSPRYISHRSLAYKQGEWWPSPATVDQFLRPLRGRWRIRGWEGVKKRRRLKKVFGGGGFWSLKFGGIWRFVEYVICWPFAVGCCSMLFDVVSCLRSECLIMSGFL